MQTAIIIPAYNAAAWVRDAIESALAQTCPASTVVVVDDGSEDATAAVAAEFGDAVVLLRQANAGVSAARNYGAAQVQAEGLLFLDADDRLRPEALAQLSERALAEGCGVAYGRTESFGDGVPPSKKIKPTCQGAPPAAALANFWKAIPSSPGAVWVRASLFQAAGGFDPQLNTAADRALWLRLGVLTPWAEITEVVLERREHPGSMVRDRDRARLQGAQAQWRFLDWCAATHPAVCADFPTALEVAQRNLERALAENLFTAAGALAQEAAARGLTDPLMQRANRYARMPNFLRRCEVAARAFLSR